jgi:hypothetical protein
MKRKVIRPKNVSGGRMKKVQKKWAKIMGNPLAFWGKKSRFATIYL